MPSNKRSLTLRVREQLFSILYHDIFDYPLNKDELLKWEVGPFDFAQGKSEIRKTGGYYHLKGRTSIVVFRKKREKESVKKLKIAGKVAKKLSTIPTIKLIGITGSLAMNNADKNSDVDLMIITAGGALWSTRVMVRIVSLLHGFMVRSPRSDEAKNAICFNMWLDEKHMEIPKKMRNLYSAHEVLQVRPLVNKDHTFEKFLDANKWALEYWPNALSGTRHWALGTRKKNVLSIAYCLTPIALLLEPIAYGMQKLYMRRKITRELVEPGRAFFHPIDWSSVVMRELKKRINKN
ncbi:hypothetical protein HYZ78_01530 [Candidatus Microgenomates bacterium]|nr:hypothetical protein [Candidatus Microgenomates bacterium]